jgi:hypothetical protein
MALASRQLEAPTVVAGRLTPRGGRRGRGCPLPGVLVRLLGQGVGNRCRAVKRDGTAGLVGWIDQLPPKAAPAGDVGRMP